MTLRAYMILAATLVAVMVSNPALADFLPDDNTSAKSTTSKERLLAYLDSDRFVSSRLNLRKYSPDVVRDLIVLAAADKHSVKVRSRAVSALALYSSDNRAVNTLGVLFKATKPRSKLFAPVLMAYMQVKGEDGVESVKPLLANRRSKVRMAAVVALGRFGGASGHDALAERQGLERNTTIKARISSYLD